MSAPLRQRPRGQLWHDELSDESHGRNVGLLSARWSDRLLGVLRSKRNEIMELFLERFLITPIKLEKKEEIEKFS